MQKRTLQIWIGLVLTLGAGSLPWPVWDNEFADNAHLLGNELIYWGLVVATIVYVRRIERRPLASIGLRRPSLVDGLIGFVFALATIAGLAALYFVIFPFFGLSEAQQIDKLAAAHPEWSEYLARRAALVTDLAHEIVDHVRAWSPTSAPA